MIFLPCPSFIMKGNLCTYFRPAWLPFGWSGACQGNPFVHFRLIRLPFGRSGACRGNPFVHFRLSRLPFGWSGACRGNLFVHFRLARLPFGWSKACRGNPFVHFRLIRLPFGEFVEEVEAPGATKRIPKKASASSHSLRRLSKSSPSAHEKDEAPASNSR